MQTIEIDEKVFKQLQQMAVPFVDTPNSVLHRILFQDRALDKRNISAPRKQSPSRQTGGEGDVSTTEEYIREVWTRRFGRARQQVDGFRMMFESKKDVVYFQNFNKTAASNLWFRLNAGPLRTMREKGKTAWVCFTNPADDYGFLIPLDEIAKRVDETGWSRDEWEVNIHVSESRWRELDWKLDRFEFSLATLIEETEE